MIKFKVVLCGSKNVGKTSLIRRYATGKFDKSTLSTIGVDFETKKVTIDSSTELMLNIWDFAGEKKFRLLFPSYVSGASGALLLYDITNKDTVDDLQDWLNVIHSVPSPPKTIILIEAKMDLEAERVITPKEVVEQYNNYKFQGEVLPTSAKTGENVEEAFEMLGREILKRSLKQCPHCRKHFPQELQFCQFCGGKT